MTQIRLSPDLDLTKYHQRRTLGDITLFLTWFGPKHERCLILIPTAKEGHEGVIPTGIMEKDAWLWDEKIGDGRYCARRTVEMLQCLGMAFSMTRAQRVTDIIRSHLEDLARMPPKPTERKVVADAIVTHESGRQEHSEIVENV